MTSSRLMDFFLRNGPGKRVVFSNGAVINAREFPVAALEVTGAVLFADLPKYSQTVAHMSPAEAACYVSHFFAWLEGSAGSRYGGIVDKFIGDAVMMVFMAQQCKLPPLEAALRTAYDTLESDWFDFEPKFGIAEGPFAVALVGTEAESVASAMGHTVNVAARCVQGALAAKSVTVAVPDAALARKVFAGKAWDVRPPRMLEAKNMPPVPVIDVVQLTKRTLAFDYGTLVKDRVRYARDQGAIVREGSPRPQVPEAPTASAPAPARSQACDPPAPEAEPLVAGLIRQGAGKCAELLSRICRADWRVESVAADTEALKGFATLLEDDSQDHFGNYFSVTGAGFLVIFDRQSGLRAALRYTGDFSEQFVMVDRVEEKTLSEVSNILINSVLGSLPSAEHEDLILSSPEARLESTRELLQAALKRFRDSENLALAYQVRWACPALHAQATLVVLLGPGWVERIVLKAAR